MGSDESPRPFYGDYSDFDSGAYADEEFEGLLELRDEGGNLYFRGAFEKGCKRIGPHLFYWPNGNVKEVSCWVDGWIYGTQLWFDEDGSLETERYFRDTGSKERRWVEVNYRSHDPCMGNDAGRIWSVDVYEDGERVSKWLSEDMKISLEAIDADEIVQRAIRKFFPEMDVDE